MPAAPSASRPEGPVVEFRGVAKRFGDVTALDGLDLAVRRGEVFGLLGPNGAGKTTAIRILCGLERASAGEARAFGLALPNDATRSWIGYMPQETALYHDLTVRENLDFFGRLHGLDRGPRQARIAELLGFVGLERRADSPVHTLSGGMRHRASLACAMLHDPDLLVLDEPTVGVDPELRASFWEHFRALAREGATLLMTTHYMDEARNCDRVALLAGGRLLAQGTPAEVARRGGGDLEAAFLALARGAR